MRFLKKLRHDKKAGTAIEYGLIAALISVAAIAAMQGIGSQLNTSFSSTSSSLAS